MGGCCGGQKLQRLRSGFFDIALPVVDKVFDCLLIWHYYKVRQWLMVFLSLSQKMKIDASLRKSQAGKFLEFLTSFQGEHYAWMGTTIGAMLLPGFLEMVYWLLHCRSEPCKTIFLWVLFFGPFTFPIAIIVW